MVMAEEAEGSAAAVEAVTVMEEAAEAPAPAAAAAAAVAGAVAAPGAATAPAVGATVGSARCGRGGPTPTAPTKASPLTSTTWTNGAIRSKMRAQSPWRE